MLELYKWHEGEYNLQEVAEDCFSILFGSQHGIQIDRGIGSIRFTIGYGSGCLDLTFINKQARPDWVADMCYDQDRLVFLLGRGNE